MVKETFKTLGKNWKTFGLLILLALGIYILFVGTNDETMRVVEVLAMLTLWLVTIFMTRRIMSGKKVRLRDGLFNAMTPLLSSLVVLVVLVVQCVPVFLVIIAYTAGVETELFKDFFSTSLFVLFAVAMVALSLYLLSGTLMAMVAVSAPGMYPLKALVLTREVMMGERAGFVARLLFMFVVLIGVWVVIVGLSILIEMGLRNLGQVVPVVNGGIYLSGCFSVIFAGVYLYLYYRKVLKIKD